MPSGQLERYMEDTDDIDKATVLDEISRQMSVGREEKGTKFWGMSMPRGHKERRAIRQGEWGFTANEVREQPGECCPVAQVCMCRLDWISGCPNIWLNVISGVVCEGLSGWNWHLICGLSKAVYPSTVGGHHPFHWEPRQDKNTDFQVFRPQLENISLAPLVLRPLDLNLHHWLPWDRSLWTPPNQGTPVDWRAWDF